MGQENRENPKGVLLQYDNILKDSYVLEHGKNPAFKKQYEHASRIVCEAVQNAQHIQDESSGITATMSLRLQATEDWEKLRR